eukprot:SAG25_NODE_166_length_13075_cov_19.523736_15_plen_36_part_00
MGLMIVGTSGVGASRILVGLSGLLLLLRTSSGRER